MESPSLQQCSKPTPSSQSSSPQLLQAWPDQQIADDMCVSFFCSNNLFLTLDCKYVCIITIFKEHFKHTIDMQDIRKTLYYHKVWSILRNQTVQLREVHPEPGSTQRKNCIAGLVGLPIFLSTPIQTKYPGC